MAKHNSLSFMALILSGMQVLFLSHIPASSWNEHAMFATAVFYIARILELKRFSYLLQNSSIIIKWKVVFQYQRLTRSHMQCRNIIKRDKNIPVIVRRCFVPNVHEVSSTFSAQGDSDLAVLWSAAAIIGFEIHAAALCARGCLKSRAFCTLQMWSHEEMRVLMSHKTSIRGLRFGILYPLCVMLLAKTFHRGGMHCHAKLTSITPSPPFPLWVFRIQTDERVWEQISH